MVALKKQEIEKIVEKEIELFSTKNIFNNDIRQMLDEYKKFYTNINVLTFLHDEELVKTALSFFENYCLLILFISKFFNLLQFLFYLGFLTFPCGFIIFLTL